MQRYPSIHSTEQQPRSPDPVTQRFGPLCCVWAVTDISSKKRGRRCFLFIGLGSLTVAVFSRTHHGQHKLWLVKPQSTRCDRGSQHAYHMILAKQRTGRPVLVTRLFEWMVTVPMLLNLVGACLMESLCTRREERVGCDLVELGGRKEKGKKDPRRCVSCHVIMSHDHQNERVGCVLM